MKKALTKIANFRFNRRLELMKMSLLGGGWHDARKITWSIPYSYAAQSTPQNSTQLLWGQLDHIDYSQIVFMEKAPTKWQPFAFATIALQTGKITLSIPKFCSYCKIANFSYRSDSDCGWLFGKTVLPTDVKIAPSTPFSPTVQPQSAK